MAGVEFDQDYFDALYKGNPDPWDFRSSEYERQKYQCTLAVLPKSRYRHMLELGSSIGELTVLLSPLAGRITGVETSALALVTATERCAHLANVSFVHAHLPDGPWAVPADAVMLSEILYYLTPDDIERLARRLMRCAPQADMVLVHWTGATNYTLTGDAAAETFIRAMHTHRARTFRAPRYRLDLLTCNDVGGSHR